MGQTTFRMEGLAAWTLAILLTHVVSVRGELPTLDELLQIPGQDDSSTQEKPPQEDATHPNDLIKMDQNWPDEPSGENPTTVLHKAVREMGHVADKLEHQLDAGLQTQRMQEAILAKLDQVISAAKKQGQQGGGGSSSGSSGEAQQQDVGSADNVGQSSQSGNSSSQPSESQNGTGGSGSAGTASAHGVEGTVIESHRTEWGNLPPRLRKELIQGLNERFSSVYKDMTADYYRRLAEESQ